MAYPPLPHGSIKEEPKDGDGNGHAKEKQIMIYKPIPRNSIKEEWSDSDEEISLAIQVIKIKCGLTFVNKNPYSIRKCLNLEEALI